MNWIKKFSDTIEMGLTWALGKGAGVLAIAAAASFANTGALVALALTIPLGTAVSTRLNFVNRNKNETQLLNQYREELGQLLGIEPEAVTRGHLRQLAEGNAKINMPSNPTLKRELESLDTSLRHSVMATVGGAAITTIIMLSFGVGGLDWIQSSLISGPDALLGGLKDFASSNFGAAMKFTGVTLTAGLIDSISKFSLKGIIKDITESKNPSGKSAHDLVKSLDIEIQRDNGVSAEQVFAVLVAGNPELSKQIERRFGADYQELPANVQEESILTFANMDAMDQLALDVSNRQIRPQSLPFIANGQLEAVVRHDGPQPTKRQEMQTKMRAQAEALGQRMRPSTYRMQEAASELSQSAQAQVSTQMQRASDALSPLLGREAKPTQSHIASVSMSSNYAEKYAPKAAPLSHVAREEARREHASLEQAQLA